MDSYSDLEKVFYKVGQFRRILNLVYYDYSTIKKRSVESTLEQIISLKELIREIITNGFTKSLIDSVEIEKLSDSQKANFNLMVGLYNSAVNVPFDMISAVCKQSLLCKHNLEKAKSSKDFSVVKQYFREIVSVTRKIADAQDSKATEKYDSLLNILNHEDKQKEINDLVLGVSQFLKIKADDLRGKIKKEKQKTHADWKSISKKLSLTNISNRSVISRGESNLYIYCDQQLTRVLLEGKVENNLPQFFHLIGKIIYTQNLPYSESYNQPICDYSGISMYSASGFLFSHFFLEDEDLLSKLNISSDKDLSQTIMLSDKFGALINLIIRFSIERHLINGELEVDDLKTAWDEDMNYYLGITDENCVGLLSNNEWFNGEFGYYSSYIKGILIAAQMFYMMKSDSNIWNGENISLKNVAKWLSSNIYSQGAKYTSNFLLKKATGEHLDCRFYKKF